VREGTLAIAFTTFVVLVKESIRTGRAYRPSLKKIMTDIDLRVVAEHVHAVLEK